MDLLPDPTLLCTQHLARAVEAHATIDSTNLRAKALARSGAPHGLVVVAEEQTSGRGRRGREWHSPPGAGLYASFVLRPSLAPKDAPLVTLAAAIAGAQAIGRLSRAEVKLKWPNDLLAPPSAGPLALKKVGGVLSELSLGAQGIDHLILGIGLNLREVERPPAVAAVATSIEALARQRVPAAMLLAELANALEENLRSLEAGQTSALLEAWRARAVGIGERVTIHSEREDREGVFIGVAPDGALMLETPVGVEVVYAGDLWLPGAPRAR